MVDQQHCENNNTNGFINPLRSCKNSVGVQNAQRMKMSSLLAADENDYSVDYDYCGIANFVEGSDASSSPYQNVQKNICGLNGHMI